MRTRRLGCGAAGWRRSIGMALLAAAGCSPAEELKPDPGVSPMFPGTPTATAPGRDAGGPAGVAGDRNPTLPDADPGAPLRPQDVERELRNALRTVEKGDLPRARAMLDRILAMEPIHREALAGRAVIELRQAKQASTPDERLAALDRADGFAAALRRAYEKPNQREIELMSQINYEQVKVNVALGRLDRAIAVLKRVHQSGFNPFPAIERDPEMAKLRDFPGYKQLLVAIEDERLAAYRQHVRELFAQTTPFPFDFDVKDIDGKPISLSSMKGKVVLVDFWGTWCGPCMEEIPGLLRMYRKHRPNGLEMVGIDYEKEVDNPEAALQKVKQVVKGMGINYPIVMATEELLQKVPELTGFPTTLLIDRTGKVRVRLAGGGEQAASALEAAAEVLLAEPVPGAKPAADKPAAKANDADDQRPRAAGSAGSPR